MKRITAHLILLIILTIPALAQNTDKDTRMRSQQEMMFNSYEATTQAFRYTSSGKEQWILDSLTYSDTAAVTDSVKEYYINKGFGLIFFTISDSGVAAGSGGITDSVSLEGYDSTSGQWYPIGGYDKQTKTFTATYAPGSGITMSYVLYDIPYKIKASLLNHRATFPERRVYITIRGVIL